MIKLRGINLGGREDRSGCGGAFVNHPSEVLTCQKLDSWMVGYREVSHLALRGVVVEMAQHYATAAVPKLDGTASAYHSNLDPSPPYFPTVFRLCPRRMLLRTTRGPCNIAARPFRAGLHAQTTRQRESPIPSLPAPLLPPPPLPPHAVQALDQAQRRWRRRFFSCPFLPHLATLNTTKGQEQEGGRRPRHAPKQPRSCAIWGPIRPGPLPHCAVALPVCGCNV
ncbi:hypothetical protein LZ30DRAFT_10903 [Colletotrichum cereale]|nr:hypothetical protein LZ30DRAFT_10903 [Colletotrichum cereale]